VFFLLSISTLKASVVTAIQVTIVMCLPVRENSKNIHIHMYVCMNMNILLYHSSCHNHHQHDVYFRERKKHSYVTSTSDTSDPQNELFMPIQLPEFNRYIPTFFSFHSFLGQQNNSPFHLQPYLPAIPSAAILSSA
jgi:hypothetical protein